MTDTRVDEAPTSDADVVVVGAGAAGIAAAVGAAQAGATVVILEQYGFLGGAATNSSVLTFCGFFDQSGEQVVRGVGQQVLDRLHGHRVYRTQTIRETGNTIVLLDQETIKSVLDDVIDRPGVTVFLHARLGDAVVRDERLTGVEIRHRGGLEHVSARAFVDCSGDGALIHESGAAALVSDVEDRQASTMVMRVGGVADDAATDPDSMSAAVHAYVEHTGADLVRTRGIAVRMPVSGEMMLLWVDQHRDVFDVAELTRAEQEGRRLSWHYLDAFRRHLPGWERAFLAATGPQIGIRESRRLHGVETVTAHDVLSGNRRADGVARCGWPMESHVSPGETEYNGIRDKGWYDIPYGAVCSSSTENLWAAGRLVSSDSRAFASLRVMGTAFATGHAAGVAAAVYAKRGHHDVVDTREELLRQGALL